jgi:hypothetical protein
MSYINKQVTGAEEPTLIFVHGFACALGDWEMDHSWRGPFCDDRGGSNR